MFYILSQPCSTLVAIDQLRRRAFLLASSAVILGMALAARVDAQTTYTYTVIADLYNCSGAYAPALNNNGDVAFGADCGAPIGRRPPRKRWTVDGHLYIYEGLDGLGGPAARYSLNQ
jgi:hypothetical protein